MMLGVAPTVGAVLGRLDARVEFVRLCHDLVRDVSEQRSGLHRLDRTQRLTAAHAVIVVTAYFETLAEAMLPFALDDVAATRVEQPPLAGGHPPARDVASGVRATEVAVPPPHGSHEEYEDAPGRYYGELSERLRAFVAGPSIPDRVSQTQWDRFTRTLSQVRPATLGRQGELMRALRTGLTASRARPRLRPRRSPYGRTCRRCVAIIHSGHSPKQRHRQTGKGAVPHR